MLLAPWSVLKEHTEDIVIVGDLGCPGELDYCCKNST